MASFLASTSTQGSGMDDLLRPVKTTKTVQNNINKFESLSLKDKNSNLRDVGRSNRSTIEIIPAVKEDQPQEHKLKEITSRPVHSNIRELQSTSTKGHRRHDSTAFLQRSYLEDSPPASLVHDAREILRSQPSFEDLKAVLDYVQFGIDGHHDFDIRVTSPTSAQLIGVIVTTSLRDVWANLCQGQLSTDEAQIKKTLLVSLRCPAGIGALLTEIKQLSSARKDASHTARLSDVIAALGAVLEGSSTLSILLTDTKELYKKDQQRKLCWRELTGPLAGGGVLNTVARAFSTNSDLKVDEHSGMWLGNGAEYSKWLAKNICTASVGLDMRDEESWTSLTEMLKRGINLGHREILVSGICSSLLLGSRALWTPLHNMVRLLSPQEQKAFFDSALTHFSRMYLAGSENSMAVTDKDSVVQKAIAGIAALIAGLIKANEVLEEHLIDLLTTSGGKPKNIGLASKRALIVVLAQSEENLTRILEKSLSNFGDKLQIQHGSIMQQDGMAQTILLALAYLSKINPEALRSSSISSLVMQAVSNRLAASVPRSRFLGMIVGLAVSRLVDTPDKVIDFGVEELESEEAMQWLGLVSIRDYAGGLFELQSNVSRNNKAIDRSSVRSRLQTKSKSKAVPETSKIISIEEVTDSEENSDDDDDLVPYEKPDSDPEDSEDDPTLVNRSKPSAPVYIIDLVKQLETNDKPDVVELALKTAPSLIRRKAGFGSELTDNIHVLATVLVNLQTGMSDQELQQLRLDSLIACVVGKPDVVAPSFASLFFEGDFSIFQRITLLTAIGLGARELAGFKDDHSRTSPNADDLFPSKRLPPHLEPPSQSQPKKLEAVVRTSSNPNPISTLATTQAQNTIRPLALAAADKLTGPSVLKIRTFSSRLEVQRKTEKKSAARTKMIPKNLHALLANSMYLPLCCRMSLVLSSTSIRNEIGSRSTVLTQSVLRLFLQTLTLVLHTLGPSASLHLQTLTHETLLLLLSLHHIPSLSLDPAVLPALLHLLLALLDITIEAGVTAQERLITEQGNQISELVTWANGLGDKISVPETGNEEGEMPWSVLVAGIQVRWFEMGQRFQGRMLGLRIDEMDDF